MAALAVVATVAPRCLASWMAIVPTPPAPEWISTLSPGFTRAISTRACHAVSATSGSDAASVAVIVVGVLVVAGLGTGVLNAVLGREAVASVPPDRAAMGSGSNNTARYLGAACGITVFTVLMVHVGWDQAVLVAAGVSLAGAVGCLVAGSIKSQA